MLHPTQPALLAVDVSALRFSIMDGTKKYFGIVRKFRIPSVDLSRRAEKEIGIVI
jgi:hypothetical protein